MKIFCMILLLVSCSKPKQTLKLEPIKKGRPVQPLEIPKQDVPSESPQLPPTIPAQNTIPLDAPQMGDGKIKGEPDGRVGPMTKPGEAPDAPQMGNRKFEGVPDNRSKPANKPDVHGTYSEGKEFKGLGDL